MNNSPEGQIPYVCKQDTHDSCCWLHSALRWHWRLRLSEDFRLSGRNISSPHPISYLSINYRINQYVSLSSICEPSVLYHCGGKQNDPLILWVRLSDLVASFLVVSDCKLQISFFLWLFISILQIKGHLPVHTFLSFEFLNREPIKRMMPAYKLRYLMTNAVNLLEIS